MNNATKLLVGTVLSFLVAVLSLYPTKVYATTQISSIKIKVEEETSSDANPTVKCNTSGCFIIPDSEIWDDDVKNCDVGESTNVTVKLDTYDGYVFKDGIKKNKIQVTNGECVDLYYNNQGELIVEIKYIIHGKLDSPFEAYWDEDHPGKARWEKVSSNVTYTVQLCRGSHKETVATGLTKTSYDFSSKLMTDYYFEHDNVYFRVKAVRKSGSSKIIKDSEYVESEYFDYWDDIDDKPSRRSSSYSSYYSYPSQSYNIGWKEYGGRWKYYPRYNECVKNNWQYVNGHWYHFDHDGWMETGWQFLNGMWYYFNTYNNNGDMFVGWHFIDGYWYYFDTLNGYMYKDRTVMSADGTMEYYLQSNGKMLTGWVYYNGEKYIDPISGIVTMTR